METMRHRSPLRRTARGAALLLGLLGAAAPPPPSGPLPVPAYREFGDWMVACDNSRACHARGFDDATRAQLDVVRPAGDAPATLDLNAEDPLDAAAIRAGEAVVPFPQPAWAVEARSIRTSDPAAVAAFIGAVRDADALRLGAAAAAGDPAPAVSLKGFSAALLFMDAVGGRVGTSGPLIGARGTNAPLPALPLPATPRFAPPPAFSTTEAARLRQQASTLPSPAFGRCDRTDPPEIHPLDARTALAIRPCYMAAYQGSAVVALLPRAGGRAIPLALPLPGLPGRSVEGPDMVDPAFDPARGEFVTVSKGRGLADCGSDESWIWSGGAFRIEQMRFQGKCGGTGPGDWLPLFRSR